MRSALLCALICGFPAWADPVFEDRSDALPSHVYGGGWNFFVGGGVAVFDCNGDALPDAFLAGGENPAKLVVNQGNFQFETAPVGNLTQVTGAYPLDIDGDGVLDLFVMRAGANLALRGQGNCVFKDATAQWGLPEDDAWTTAFTAWWPDGAARPTMAVGNYVDRDNPDGPFEACDTNAVLTPMDDGYVSTPLSPGFCPLSMLAARDARGRNGLRLSNDRHYYVKGGYEQIWDIEEQRFLDMTDGWPRVSLWGMGVASRDLTGDGRDEVILTSMGDQLMQIAQNDGTYTSAPFSIGTYAQRPHVGGDGRPSTGWHAEFADVDNDARADLFIAKGNVDQMPGMATKDPNNLLMQQPDGTFREASIEAGVASFHRSRGGALADFDLDGRLDLIVVNRRAPAELYRNVTADVGNWLRVVPKMLSRNRDAIGAVVTVVTPESTQSIQRVVGGGHAGGQLLPMHFGLADAQTAQVRVEWPDGQQTSAKAVAGQTLVIRKP
ncbi:MAG: CRTAC1 family protein [Roseobacter sp.]